ncbi:LysE family transporter [Pleomorphomonas oryzae]|uniref:LysE family transporter n=1 Tax=Pleomorphomonas oryzae TaxID=261934 RepID=UPI000424CF66|nr:LysE family transporter [Pleomorphomonas oryzae]
MTLAATLSAALLLLLLPGPTNALVAAATATGGLRRLPGTVAAVVIAYGLALCLLGLGAGLLTETAPVAAPVLKLLASAALILSAVKIWRADPAGPSVSTHRIFLITLINPKALVLAFAILPPGFPSPILAVGTAAAITVATGIWGLVGIVLGRLGRRYVGAGALNRATAGVLAAFAGALMVTTAVAAL